MTASKTPALQLLAVCTGNVCRSPSTAALLERRLAELGTTATAHSAGVLDTGLPMPRPLLKELARRDVAIDPSLRVPLRLEAIREADIVIGLERSHVRNVILLVPEVADRTFSLKELVRRGEQLGALAPSDPLAGWLQTLAATRQPTDLIGASRRDDVADPYGRSRRAYRRAVAEIDDLSARVARLLPHRDDES